MSREFSPEVIRICTEGTFEERLRLARTMSGEDKISLGCHLFDIECRKERAALRTEFPWAPEPLIQKFLHDRADARRDLPCFDLPIIIDAPV